MRVPLYALILAASLSAQEPRWVLPADSQTAGYTFEITRDDNAPLATLIPPADGHGHEGVFTSTQKAVAYRGRVLTIHASLRVEEPHKGARARLWTRIERPQRAMGFLDDFSAVAVTADQWTTSEITLGIPADAEAITFGIRSEGGARVQMRDFSIVPDAGHTQPPLPETSEVRGPLPPRPSSALPEPTDGPNLPPPDHAEQSRIINAAAHIALGYVRNLPDFLCTEVTTRSQNKNLKGWRQLDVLAIRVGYEGGGEHYRLLTINGKTAQVPLRLLQGAQTEGEFGSVQHQLFQPHVATFHWERYAILRGRTVSVFEYHVPLEKSGLHLTFGSMQNGADTIAAYHGYVFIDHDTNEVMRIDQIAEPPARFPILESRNVLDYDRSMVGGQPYLLPIMSESFIDSAGLSSHNVVEFREYQKFSAESKIEFQ